MRTRRVAVAATLGVGAWWAAAAPAAAAPPGVGVIRDFVGGVAGWGFDRITAGIAAWVLGALGSFIEGILGFLSTSARPDVQSVWFAGPDSPYASVRAIAGALMVAFALLGLVSGLLKGDAGGMARRIAVGLPLTVVAMVATTAVVAKGLALTDALSAEVLDPAGSDAASFLGAISSGASGTGGGFAVVVVALVGVVAGLVVWVELLVRSALVYLLVALSPLAFATTVWPATKGVARRLVELLVAVVVSKLVVCIALATGVAALAGAVGEGRGPDSAGMAGGLGALIVGCAVLAMAAFSPFVVLRLMPLAEAAVVAQGLSRAPMRGATSAMATYATATGGLSRLAGPAMSGATGRMGSAGGGTAGPPGAPGAPGAGGNSDALGAARSGGTSGSAAGATPPASPAASTAGAKAAGSATPSAGAGNASSPRDTATSPQSAAKAPRRSTPPPLSSGATNGEAASPAQRRRAASPPEVPPPKSPARRPRLEGGDDARR
ncbi:MAG TPA: type IV secretion system protein [Acidimicrobiales bacterium]|nr:type IV secretion system protein [Acidimicrobiales bacterium]